MKKEKPADALDMIALILNAIALVPNLMIFLPLLHEQIETGWGFPTHFEMGVLFFWLVQFFTLPFIFLAAGYTLFCLIKRIFSRLFSLNAAILCLTIISLVLSIVFEYN